jgi:hypothetical protein
MNRGNPKLEFELTDLNKYHLIDDDIKSLIEIQLLSSYIDLTKRKIVKRFEVDTLTDITPMRRVVEKLGYKLESIRKGRIFKDGKNYDEVSYYMWQ